MPKIDKLRLMQFLATELVKEEDANFFVANQEYPVWSPYNCSEAANILRIQRKAIAQNPLYCAFLTAINCDLMGKRFLGRASSLRDAMRSLSHFISLNCERFLGRASLSLDIQNSRYKLLGTHW